jgi:Asp-tRNA(Asn)/Glu-tRNA(Gln) amidotransferase A subunit family amidase
MPRKEARGSITLDAYPTKSQGLTATNLTGHPQVVVPCGFVDGLPQGLLFTGRLFEEGTPVRLALAYEKATEWHKRRPQLQS